LRSSFGKILPVLGVFLILWLVCRYFLGAALPFLLGGLIALAAEPAVALAAKKLPRGLSAGLGVTATLLGAVGIVSLLGALAVRELGQLADAVPDIQQTAQQGLALLQDQLLTMADRAPEGIRSLLQKTVLQTFEGSPALLERAALRLPGLVSGLLSKLPGGALGIGTGVLAGYMLSARLPRIKAWLAQKLPRSWHEKTLPALRRLRHALWGWIKAQAKLCGVTFLIVTAGFLLLRVPFAPLWAALVALVDAVPVLGTGTVLLPWALAELLQGNTLRFLGLVGTYGAALLTRTVLEPRLVGKHLGLDPLITLVCFYLGFKFWGLPGMLLTPMLAAAAVNVTSAED